MLLRIHLIEHIRPTSTRKGVSMIGKIRRRNLFATLAALTFMVGILTVTNLVVGGPWQLVLVSASTMLSVIFVGIRFGNRVAKENRRR